MMPAHTKYTRQEELANAISHLGGAALAVSALVLMVVYSALRGNAWHIVTTSIYGSTLFLLYFSSGMAHALKQGKAKHVFFVFDRISIFLLIAGTYTPLALVILNGAMGWVIFGLEWGLAAAGIILTFSRTGRKEGINYFFVFLYATMGWMLIIALVPLLKSMAFGGVFWILLGGIFYTTGIFFYAKARFLFHHLVWHILVLAGSFSHFMAIFYYIIPGK
jgi:hemolysin III